PALTALESPSLSCPHRAGIPVSLLPSPRWDPRPSPGSLCLGRGVSGTQKGREYLNVKVTQILCVGGCGCGCVCGWECLWVLCVRYEECVCVCLCVRVCV